ncbi:MAG: hypothetical protein ABIW81_01825 [Terrimesophilobacter sp.]
MPTIGSSAAGETPVTPSVRAQLLATEHWSLLASRTTTQNEVLTRIAIFLTIVSAGLVSLALVGQATKFSDAFLVFAVVVLGFVILIGVLTEFRVRSVSMEDLMYVLAMNRLRAAYTQIDPGIGPYLMASVHDDLMGSQQTYDFLAHRRSFSHVAGSTMVFIAAVNAALVGLFVAGIAAIWGAHLAVIVTVGALLGGVYLIASITIGARKYFEFWKRYVPHNPSPEVVEPR